MTYSWFGIANTLILFTDLFLHFIEGMRRQTNKYLFHLHSYWNNAHITTVERDTGNCGYDVTHSDANSARTGNLSLATSAEYRRWIESRRTNETRSSSTKQLCARWISLFIEKLLFLFFLLVEGDVAAISNAHSHRSVAGTQRQFLQTKTSIETKIYVVNVRRKIKCARRCFPSNALGSTGTLNLKCR